MRDLIAACQDHARMHVVQVVEADPRYVGREDRAVTERSATLDNCPSAARFCNRPSPLFLRGSAYVLSFSGWAVTMLTVAPIRIVCGSFYFPHSACGMT